MTRPRLLAALVGAFAAATALIAQDRPAPPASPLVTVRKGTMPVILSAPHGGLLDMPGVPPRRGVGLPVGPNGFFTGRDGGTEELAGLVAVEVFLKTGQRPYLVAARFNRKYIDANRPPDIAYEDPKAKPAYDAYHGTLAAFCKEVRAKHGRGLLLDIHSQGAFAGTVLRGTADGKTVALLRQRFGEKAHTGPDSFFGLLAGAGFKVHPTKPAEKEDPSFSGGHVVKTYGGGDYGIDAIQLEFGWTLATPNTGPDTAEKVAAVIDRFHRLYLVDRK
jgi:N-formylglutamate amidohydrolase